jgi:hypothetical protein
MQPGSGLANHHSLRHGDLQDLTPVCICLRTAGNADFRTKKNRPAGRFFSIALITWQQRHPKQPKQRSKRQQQRPKQPKRRSKQQQQRQQLEQQRQQLELLVQQQRPLQEQVLLELQQLELLVLLLVLFCCKQPKQQPTGRRSAGIFSWVFLKISKLNQQCCDE